MSDPKDNPVGQHTLGQSPDDVERLLTPTDSTAIDGSLFAPGRPVPNLEMWVLERRLGSGGFGEVWLARHERKGVAAVKFCTAPAARHQLVTHERTVVARVMKHAGNHPNIVPLLECNLSGDIPWLMYEYVEGGTLAEAVAEWKKYPPPRRLGRAVRVLHTLAAALGTFHRLTPPLIHRDLKPQNVLMAGRTPRITDFGIGGAAVEVTKLDATDTGTVNAVRVPTILQTAGSARYSPPEQLFGSAPDARDDVFALGVIAYQMIVGDLKAIPGPEAGAELRAQRVPQELTTLIAQSIALDPDHRPRDAATWELVLAALIRKKTAAPRLTSATPSSNDKTDPTEPLEALIEPEMVSDSVSQMLDLRARGRWYSREAGHPAAQWQLVATTPAEVRLSPGEVYRFSIHTAATEHDIAAVAVLAPLVRLRYLNLSYCDGVTDAGLAHLVGFAGLRLLFLRGCRNLTDAGLAHLRGLTRLDVLELTDCPGVTAAGVAALKQALPNCKIHH